MQSEGGEFRDVRVLQAAAVGPLAQLGSIFDMRSSSRQAFKGGLESQHHDLFR